MDWLRPDEVFQLLAGLETCSLELGRLNLGPPYPVDGTVGNSFEPPYPPPSQELPGLFGGVMPAIEPPCGIHEINTVEEEEDNELVAENELPVSTLAHHISKDQPSTTTNLTEREHEESAETDSETGPPVTVATEARGPGMYQFRQLILPLAPAPPSCEDSPTKWAEVDRSFLRPGLGMRLVKGPGISGPVVVYVKADSPAAQAGLRPTDRILGLDDSLLLAVAANRAPLEIVEMIESNWLERCVGSFDPPKPVCLTVISSTPAPVEPKEIARNQTPLESSGLHNGFRAHSTRLPEHQNGSQSSPDSTLERNPLPVQENKDPSKITPFFQAPVILVCVNPYSVHHCMLLLFQHTPLTSTHLIHRRVLTFPSLLEETLVCNVTSKFLIVFRLSAEKSSSSRGRSL